MLLSYSWQLLQHHRFYQFIVSNNLCAYLHSNLIGRGRVRKVGFTSQGGETPILKWPGCPWYLLEVFTVKRSTAGAFAVPFRVLSENHLTGGNGLFEEWFLLGVKNVSSHTHKTRAWYLGGSFQTLR